MQRHNLFHDGQTQASTGNIGLASLLSPVKAIKQMGYFSIVNAHAAVGDLQANHAFLCHKLSLHKDLPIQPIVIDGVSN